MVLDIERHYILATEYLEWPTCLRKVIGWSETVLEQLDVAHRLQFPVTLMHRGACDIQVIQLLQVRGLGNSPSQVRKKIAEQHQRYWNQRVALYLADCQRLCNAANRRQTVDASQFDIVSEVIPVPTFQWFLTVYCHDVMRRVDELKASITSTFGRVLKLDSTKKIVRKLAGHSAGTAAWATNVGNEHGQVLMTVLTAAEGCGLKRMISGIINRYASARVQPPELLYVDRDCCGGRSIDDMFSKWPEMKVRLDIWHFMRRFASTCTTESHQLYPNFLRRLSSCIFVWSADDVGRLKLAKHGQLQARNILHPTDEDVLNNISRKEMALHCQRATRGVDNTTVLIHALLTTFDGEEGRDSMGVPLLDTNRLWEVWETQKRHIHCIQDPEGIQLYTKIGEMTKGGVTLPVYRCARGSTSLESFHLHLNRFVPGTRASDLHFQAYLMEGLVRWNKDRADAAADSGLSVSNVYSGLQHHAVNVLSEQVLGKKVYPTFQAPNRYTGELIGVEYLFDQTNQVLDNTFDEDPEDEDEDEVAANLTDEGYIEMDDPTQPPIAPLNPTSTRAAAKSVSKSPSPEHMALVEEEESSIGPDNIPGFERVEALAEFLFRFREDSGVIDQREAKQIIDLWQNLEPYDKTVRCKQRFKDRLVQGRFKTSKKSTVVARVESTRR